MAAVHVLHIRNMVCPRCITAVRGILTSMGFKVGTVELGQAEIVSQTPALDRKLLDRELQKQGFELIIGEDEHRVEQVKVRLLEYVKSLESSGVPVRISSYLSDRLHIPYSQLSKLFSRKTGHTVEKHVILLKIERVKELISYGEHTLSEIAYRLQYSSVQHLSTQFKHVTGLSVSDYKSLRGSHRHPLDSISSPR